MISWLLRCVVMPLLGVKGGKSAATRCKCAYSNLSPRPDSFLLHPHPNSPHLFFSSSV